ncbi:MAG: TIGR03087 family PEP-CTERM/XrtA system glycosyltransferase [Phycisphaerae bacterium]|jgi:sugar transferase (PEP-CTERM/EpsH1 system associated)
MNILMVTPRFPYPPNRGDCIRAWGELRHLARQHQVWLACVDHQQPTPDQLCRVRTLCADMAVAVRSPLAALWRGGLSLLSGASIAEGYFADAGLRRQITAWAEKVRFDVVLIFAPEMADLARDVPARRRVLDMNDVESFKWHTYAQQARGPLRWLCAWEARRLVAAERRWASTHDVCLLVNERERGKLLDFTHPQCAAVVRTGVDLAALAGDGALPALASVPRLPVIGFVGSMFYAPNVDSVNWFGKHVWPLVQQHVPAAQWLIVGNRPRPSVRRWGREPGITVTGFVEDVRPYYAQMRVFICGATTEIGVQTKLIEAMAAGRPCVVSSAAAAGIDHEGSLPFLVADNPAQFAAAVVRLLKDDALADELGARARKVATQYYDAEAQYAEVEHWLTGDEPPAAPTPSIPTDTTTRRTPELVEVGS